MRSVFKNIVLGVVAVTCFLLDVAATMALAYLITSPLIYFADYRFWIIVGTICGALLNGLWELCDVFGILGMYKGLERKWHQDDGEG